MSKVSKHSFELGRVRCPTAMIDKWSFLPILAFVYASIVMPLISFVSPPATLQSEIEGQPRYLRDLQHVPIHQDVLAWRRDPPHAGTQPKRGVPTSGMRGVGNSLI